MIYAYIRTELKGLDVILQDNGNVLIRTPNGEFCVEIPADRITELIRILDWFKEVQDNGKA